MYSLYTPTTAFNKPKTRRDFKGNIWRELCARAIEANCGYRSRHGGSALSWDVSCSGYIRNYWDTLVACVVENGDLDQEEINEIDPAKLADIHEEWERDEHQGQMWSDTIEDMQRSLTDSDCYRSLRPEMFTRYGLVDEEGGTYFDVKWEFHGRGGKHLCLMEFEGHSLKSSADDLATGIREDDGGNYLNGWCQKLLAFIHECDLMFTSKNVEDEYVYQLAFRLGQELQEALDVTRAEKKEAALVQEFAERDIITTKE